MKEWKNGREETRRAGGTERRSGCVEESTRRLPGSPAPRRSLPFFLSSSIRPFLLSLLVVLPAYGQVETAVRAFDAGNRHYTEGRYRDALTAYDEALASGYEGAALYYNMGNAYYRLDELGQAVRFYEKARRLRPDDRQVLHNLEMARNRTIDRFSQVPAPFWRPAWRGLVRLLGAGGLFGIGLVLYLAAAGLLGYRLWTGTRNAWNRRGLAVALIGSVLFIGSAFLASLDRRLDRQAVIVAAAAPLHEAPDADAASELALHAGLLIDVLDAEGGWLEVRLPNGVRGWIEANAAADV